MAKAARRRQRRGRNSRRSAGLSRGTVAAVMVIACAGALAWYYRSALESPPRAPAPPATSRAPKPAPAEPKAPVAEESERFEFYDMLPDAEVEVPVQPTTSGGAMPAPISVPGTYVVQAGAFPNFEEADKVKARLALLGIVSEIQVADTNERRFHRVRIGPIDNLDQLNRLRNRLRQNGIEYLVIPVGE